MPSFSDAYIQAAINAANELGGLTVNTDDPYHNDQYDAYRHAMLSADLANLKVRGLRP